MPTTIVISDDEVDDQIQEIYRSPFQHQLQSLPLAHAHSGAHSELRMSADGGGVHIQANEIFSRSNETATGMQVTGTTSATPQTVPFMPLPDAVPLSWPSAQPRIEAQASSSLAQVIDLTRDDVVKRSYTQPEQPREANNSSSRRTGSGKTVKYADTLDRPDLRAFVDEHRLPAAAWPRQIQTINAKPFYRDKIQEPNIEIDSPAASLQYITPSDVAATTYAAPTTAWSTNRNMSTKTQEALLSSPRTTPMPPQKLSGHKSRSEETVSNQEADKDQPNRAIETTSKSRNFEQRSKDSLVSPASSRPRWRLNGPKPQISGTQNLFPRNVALPCHHVNREQATDGSEPTTRSQLWRHGDVDTSQNLSTAADRADHQESDSDDASVRMRRSIYQASAMYAKPAEMGVTEDEAPQLKNSSPTLTQLEGKEVTPAHSRSKSPDTLGSPVLGHSLPTRHATKDASHLTQKASQAAKADPVTFVESAKLADLDRIRDIFQREEPSTTQSITQTVASNEAVVYQKPRQPSIYEEASSLDTNLPQQPVGVTLDTKLLGAIFKPMVEEMQIGQEYLVSGFLSRARKDTAEALGPNIEQSLPDPFAMPFASPENKPVLSNPPRRVRMESKVINARHKPPQITDSLAVAFKSECARLPKYNSIVRLKSNVLARNDKDLRYLPYFPQEEDKDGADAFNSKRREELLEGFDHRIKFLPEERRCAEKAHFWREHTEYFLEEVGCKCVDVMYYLLHDEDDEWRPKCQLSKEALSQWQKRETGCGACGTKFEGDRWDRLSEALTDYKPDEEILALAGLVCSVFSNAAKFSIWHIASTHPTVQSLMWETERRWSAERSSKAPRTESLCMLCHIYCCPTHGAYLEDDHQTTTDTASELHGEGDEESSSGSEGKSDRYNFRQTVALPERSRAAEGGHRCGYYCINNKTRCTEILGLHTDGDVRGSYNTTSREFGDPGFADNESCSDSCFWKIANRPEVSVADLVTSASMKRQVDWSQKDMIKYRSMLSTVIEMRRGPCIMKTLLTRPCHDIFREMLIDIHHTAHPAPETQMEEAQSRAAPFPNEYKDKNYWFESSLAYDHHKRLPLVPCSHRGGCYKNAGCTCWLNRVACEWICGCNRSCSRRFQGCRCIARGSKVCFKDSSCDCYVLNRECDPWLCGKCGVHEVLDPVNRHHELILKGRCKNAMIQRNIPKRTLKAPSEVHGWGLFAGTDIRVNEYIGEYKGEVISEEESNRRGLVYHYRGLEYLFRLNKDQEIDSSRAGNKMRFINNSERPGTINVYPQTMLCNGVQRIGLFAKRHIVAGEELFFNYGYPESVTRNFWEKEDIEDGRREDDAAEPGIDAEVGEEMARPRGVKSSAIAAKRQNGKGLAKKVKRLIQKPGGSERRARFYGDDTADEDDPKPRFSGRKQSSSANLSHRKKRKRTSTSPVIDETILDPPSAGNHGERRANTTNQSDLEDAAAVGPSSLSFGIRTDFSESGDDDEYQEDEQNDASEDDDDDRLVSGISSDSWDEVIASGGRGGGGGGGGGGAGQTRPYSLAKQSKGSSKTAAARAASLVSRRRKREEKNNKKKMKMKMKMKKSGAGVKRGNAVSADAPGPVPSTSFPTTSATQSSSSSRKQKLSGAAGQRQSVVVEGERKPYQGRKRGRPVGWKKGIDFK